MSYRTIEKQSEDVFVQGVSLHNYNDVKLTKCMAQVVRQKVGTI